MTDPGSPASILLSAWAVHPELSGEEALSLNDDAVKIGISLPVPMAARTVRATALNVRLHPHTDAPIIGILNQGEAVHVWGMSEQGAALWLLVERNGLCGWAAATIGGRVFLQ